MHIRSHHCAFAFFILLVPVALGQSLPQTAPSRPPNLDQVVSIKPITLSSKGLSPRDALAAISKQTAIPIYPFARATSQFIVSPTAPPWDLWTSRNFDLLTFDLTNESFWGSLRRIAQAANLTIDRGGRNVLINRESNDRALATAGNVSESPSALCHIIQYARQFRRGNAILWMHVYVDPRVCFTSLPSAKFESAIDDTGKNLRPVVGHGAPPDCTWRMFLPIYFSDGAANARQLSRFSGYLPLQVVTKSQTAELPLQLGAVKEAGPWTLTLEDFGERGQIVGGSKVYSVYIGLERRDASDVPIPENLFPLVRLLDKDGTALAQINSELNPPKPLQSRGLRQWVEFQCRHEDGQTAEPAKLTVDLPLEIKPAAIPFDFKNVDLAASNDRE